MESLWKIIYGIKRIQAGGVKAITMNRYLVDTCERAVKLAVDIVVEILRELAVALGWRVPEDRRGLVRLFRRKGVLSRERAEILLQVLGFTEVVERTEEKPVDRFMFIEPREVYTGIEILRSGLEEVAKGLWDFAETRRVVMKSGTAGEIEHAAWREVALAEA